jgi:hypothetical protein
MIVQSQFERIKSLEQMFRAAEASVGHYYTACMATPSLIHNKGFSHRDIRDCQRELEDTYLIRIFAEFEETLRDFWKCGRSRSTWPKTKPLVDSIAAYCQVVEDDVNRVHSVRDYRNSLLHGGSAPKVALAEGRGYLCKFLSHLPRSW